MDMLFAPKEAFVGLDGLSAEGGKKAQR